MTLHDAAFSLFDSSILGESIFFSPTLAEYSLRQNRLFLTVNVLQQPYFDSSFPFAINFGALGSAVAHELVYGLSGSSHYKNDIMDPLWSSNTLERFEKLVECLTQQLYSNYTMNNMSLNGENMLSKKML